MRFALTSRARRARVQAALTSVEVGRGRSWRCSKCRVGRLVCCELTRQVEEVGGYWISEPGLLLRPSTEDRLHQYVINWVRLRLAWLYLLCLREARVTRVPTQWWRDILYGSSGKAENDKTKCTAQHWREIEEVFGMAFDRVNLDLSPSGAPQWHNKIISVLNTAVCQPIT